MVRLDMCVWQGSPDWQKRNGRLSNRQSCLCCAACSREFSIASTNGPSTGNGFRQPTGTSSAASSWSAIDMPAPIAVQTSSSKPIISFRSAAAVPMTSSTSRLPAGPAICRKARRQWRTGAHRDVSHRQASSQTPNRPRHSVGVLRRRSSWTVGCSHDAWAEAQTNAEAEARCWLSDVGIACSSR